MPKPPRQCQRCGLLLERGDPFVVVEVSALVRHSPHCARHLLCEDCGMSISNYLRMPPMLLEELEPFHFT